MPRPARSRVAPSRPAQVPAAPAPAPEPSKPSDTDEVGEKQAAQNRKEEPSVRRTRSAAHETRRASLIAGHDAKALEASKQRRDDAFSRLENMTSTTADDIESPPVATGRRSQMSMRRTRATDISGLDLDDETFGDLDNSFNSDEDEEAPSGQRSTDTSSFNVAMFKRRPRQSSIVSRDDAPIRPSSRGPNTPGLSSTFSLGVFKRRAREPSILGTAQKDRSSRPASRAAYHSEDEEGAALAAEVEATPLDATKRQSTTGRKRKSLEEHEGRGKRRASGGEDEAEQAVEVDESLPSSPPIVQHERPTTPEMDIEDPDLAPPASSGSSNGSPGYWPSMENLRHRAYASRRPADRAKTPELDDNDDVSDMSSPPSLTHSPGYSAPKRAPPKRNLRKRDTSPKLTTATLTSLMARRRRKPTDDDPFSIESSDEELDTSHLANDEDELSYGNSRAARPKKASKQNQGASSRQASAAKKDSAAGKRVRRTYGTRNSDKENDSNESEAENAADGSDAPSDNEDDPAESFENSQAELDKLGNELRAAAKKFKEVDRWELSFEEVTEASSPSGKNAR